MNKFKVSIGIAVIAIASFIFIAADHLDAPEVGGTTSDITDFYAFEGANEDNTVFVANVQGLLSPGANAMFDEDVMIEINIDNDNDLVEDLVIQAIPRDGIMYFYGPVAPGTTGLSSSVLTTATANSVEITEEGESEVISNNNGMSFFAGPREDAFFFDFESFNALGNADSEESGPGAGFQTAENASDTFDGTNVLSIVVEVPNSMLGSTFDHPFIDGIQVFNAWVTSNRKQ